MEKKKSFRYLCVFILLISLLIFLFVLNLNTGSVKISISEINRILFKKAGDNTAYHIIWDIRFPRVISAMLLGGALSVAGFLLQTFFHNPIAGPFVLGVSSGAKLMVSLAMVFCLTYGKMIHSAILIGAAFIGAMISMGFILIVSSKVDKMAMLVVCGVMIGYICSAITDFIITFADDSNIVNLHNWSLGSFSGMTWENVQVIAVVVCISFFLTFFMSKPIHAYQMGENYAANMGVNIKLFRISLILLSGILAACVTAFAGPISFVGVAVPHLIRGIFKTSKPIIIIPGSFIGGAVFCLACDWIARVCFAPTEISISSVTSVLGAPIVIYIMINRKKKKG